MASPSSADNALKTLTVPVFSSWAAPVVPPPVSPPPPSSFVHAAAISTSTANGTTNLNRCMMLPPFPRSPFGPQDALSVNSPLLAVPRIRDALGGHAAWLALASDLLVPVSTPLGYTRLRCEIDVHQPEAPRVPVRPLEVVQEGPHEESLEWHAGLPCPQRCCDVFAQVRDPSRVLDLTVVTEDVLEGRTVLRDHDAGRRVLPMHPQQQLGQDIRLHRPTHLGHRNAVGDDRPGTERPRQLLGFAGSGNRSDRETPVVVHAQDVARPRDHVQIPVAHERHVGDRPVELDQLLGVAAAEDRIEV